MTDTQKKEEVVEAEVDVRSLSFEERAKRASAEIYPILMKYGVGVNAQVVYQDTVPPAVPPEQTPASE